ncbi:MAG: MFS transporter, partial [Gammaproteobacteria bacterium AqS3]|nr:MFS transporter [Gammaproteobacteria bacterium AqS3]
MSGAWRDSLTVYLRRRVFVLLPLGFSAGLPLLLVFGTLTLYLREAGVERATIGYLSWIGILFSFKVFWSPLVDHLNLGALTRRLGHRRSWMLLAQLGIAASLIGLALSDPAVSLQTIVWFALLTTFFSATQDICIDAFRIESVEEDEQGAAAAMYQAGYRLGMLVAGAGALYLAEFYGWRTAYIGMAGCALIGVATTVLLARELARRQQGDASDAPTDGGAIDPLAWLRRALFDPFASFFRRHGRIALAILALIGFYRLSDISLGIMA